MEEGEAAGAMEEGRVGRRSARGGRKEGLEEGLVEEEG